MRLAEETTVTSIGSAAPLLAVVDGKIELITRANLGIAMGIGTYKYLSNYLPAGYTPADLAYGSIAFGTDLTVQVQAVLDTASAANPLILVWDAKVSITGVRIKSYTTIVAYPGCGAILRDSSNNYLFTNFTHGGNTITDREIHIRGGIWNCNGYQGTTAKQIHSNSTKGMIVGFYFNGVSGMTWRDFTITNTRTYTTLVITAENVLVDNIRVDQGADPQINQDGIDWCGYINNLTITNSYIRCGDDRIALFPNPTGGVGYGEDHTPYTGLEGDITNVKIDNIIFDGHGKGIRLQCSSKKIEHVRISNLSGITRCNWLVMESMDNLTEYTFSPGPGWMDDVICENIAVETVAFYPYDNAASRKGSVLMACNIGTVKFKNIKRNDFSLADVASFHIHNNGASDIKVIQSFELDGYNVHNLTPANVTPHIRAIGSTIKSMRVNNVAVDLGTTARNASVVVLEGTAVVDKLMFNGVDVNSLHHIVRNGATLRRITASDIIHLNAGGQASFFTSPGAIDKLVLGVYDGVLDTSGSITTKVVSGTSSTTTPPYLHNSQFNTNTTGALTAYTPETGAAWQVAGGPASIVNNYLRFDTTTTNPGEAYTNAGATNVTIEIKINSTPFASNNRLIARKQSAVLTGGMIFADYERGASGTLGTLVLKEYNGATVKNIASLAVPYVANAIMRLTVSGTTATASYNGSSISGAVVYTTGNLHGVGGVSTAGNDQIDYFTIVAAPAA